MHGATPHAGGLCIEHVDLAALEVQLKHRLPRRDGHQVVAPQLGQQERQGPQNQQRQRTNGIEPRGSK